MKVGTPPVDSLSGVSLLRGVQPHWEQQEPYNMVLEASLGYTASCSVVVMDKVADLNERVDVEMREVEEDVRMLKGEVSGILSKFCSFLPISFIFYCANHFISLPFISLTILDHQ